MIDRVDKDPHLDELRGVVGEEALQFRHPHCRDADDVRQLVRDLDAAAIHGPRDGDGVVWARGVD